MTRIHYTAHLDGATDDRTMTVSADDIESIMLTIEELDGTLDKDDAVIEVYAFECREYGYQSVDDGYTTWECQ